VSLRLVDGRWGTELTQALQADASALRIVSPFVKLRALDRLLALSPRSVQVITRYNLDDFASGVSDIAALRRVLATGGRVRGIRGLHAKLYLFGASRAVVTSANLTGAALDSNHEFGAVTDDPTSIATCRAYFDRLWTLGGMDLSAAQLDAWSDTVTRHRAGGGPPTAGASLGDFGADAGIDPAPPTTLPVVVADASQAFVKFLGESDDRVPLTCPTVQEIERSGCQRVLAYPASKRPRRVKDDALMYVARLTDQPNDIRIFGRAVGMAYVDVRDDASAADIALRRWRGDWSRYIRVHQAEFVAGTMANGVSLNALMDELGADAFAATQRNAAKKQGNTNPRRAYLQAADVELSLEGTAWLRDRLQAAFDTHGTVPRDVLAAIQP
jgi:PLD-like domain